MTTPTHTASPDDIAGIVIHRANQLTAYLGAHGGNSNWAFVAHHLVAMHELVGKAHDMTLGAGQQAGADQAEARVN